MENKISLLEKFKGLLLGTAVGDILGVPIEGETRSYIQLKYGELRDFIQNFIGDGCYSDDTQMTLALASSLTKCGKLDPKNCALEYAHFFQSFRSYGGGTERVLTALKNGANYQQTGTISHPKGSFANGGAMRIAPLGGVYRNQSNAILKQAVFDAVRSTHIHPEGIDGALLQAKAIALIFNIKSTTDFKFEPFWESLFQILETKIMKKQLILLKKGIEKAFDDNKMIEKMGSSARASQSVPLALFAFLKYFQTPEEAVIKAVNFGGDTDTIGAMTGALIGALYGSQWIPRRWFNAIENGAYGRDEMVQMAEKLSQIQLE